MLMESFKELRLRSCHSMAELRSPTRSSERMLSVEALALLVLIEVSDFGHFYMLNIDMIFVRTTLEG